MEKENNSSWTEVIPYVGVMMLNLAVLAGTMSSNYHRDKELMKAMPQAHKVDSTYHARRDSLTKAYNFQGDSMYYDRKHQMDSLRNIYKNTK